MNKYYYVVYCWICIIVFAIIREIIVHDHYTFEFHRIETILSLVNLILSSVILFLLVKKGDDKIFWSSLLALLVFFIIEEEFQIHEALYHAYFENSVKNSDVIYAMYIPFIL